MNGFAIFLIFIIAMLVLGFFNYLKSMDENLEKISKSLEQLIEKEK